MTSDSIFLENYKKWLSSPALNQAEKQELKSIACDEEEIRSRFYGPLEFGTAGLRGIMGIGTARMNVYVIRHVTQCFANVILKDGGKDKTVAICYDCRNNSSLFAKEAACIMAANGIGVRLFEDMRPTPELSFAIRKYGCAAGINVTASHNPKEYNGYKVYWSDGAQLPPHKAAEIAAEMAQNDTFACVKTMDYGKAAADGIIKLMGAETDELFLSEVLTNTYDNEDVRKAARSFKVVYTPFHGAGRELVPESLHRIGIDNVICVPEQMAPDGNFSTVKSPNPENPEGFYLAVDLADKHGADFILGTDPDSDRVGIMARKKDGTFAPVTGNQTGVLMLDYLIGAMKRAGKLPESPVALKTIVTTDMARVAAEANGVRCFDTFTGFKFMAEKKNELENAGAGKVIFSYEESYGYMVGDYVRDKDAVTASLLLTQMAAWYALRGMTVFDALDELYAKYGYYAEKTVNLVMPGLDGIEKMRRLTSSLRENPPKEIEGTPVASYTDYLSGVITDFTTGDTSEIQLRGSNVMQFTLAHGGKILVRPSGTEPKIKVYILLNGDDTEKCAAQLDKYEKWAYSLA